MIVNEFVEVKIHNKNAQYYKDLGYDIPLRLSPKNKYVFDIGNTIQVKPEDLLKGTHTKITARCDVCGNENQISYKDYLKNYNKHNYYCCMNCASRKRADTLLEHFGVDSPLKSEAIKNKVRNTCVQKYGVEYVTQAKEVKDKIRNTCKERYGFTSIGLVPQIQNKAKETNKKKYGSEYVMGTNYFKEKSKKFYQKKYGESVTHCSQVQDVKNKKSKSYYKHNSCKTSSQQYYIHKLYGGELNYSFNSYNFDILLNNDIDVEVDFSGHDLCVRIGKMTQEQFDQKEIIRNNQIKRAGYKIIRLISRTDKLPSDEILLRILDISKDYFASTNHTWIEWYFDENKFRNAENLNGSFFDFGDLRRLKKSA